MEQFAAILASIETALKIANTLYPELRAFIHQIHADYPNSSVADKVDAVMTQVRPLIDNATVTEAQITTLVTSVAGLVKPAA